MTTDDSIPLPTAEVPQSFIDSTVFDTDRWVRAWIEMVPFNPQAPYNEQVMRGWFNRAIRTGYEHAQMKVREEIPLDIAISR